MGRWLNWAFLAFVVLSLIYFLLPAMQTRHGPRSRRLQSASNLRQIGLGLMAYGNRYHYWPPGAIHAPDGSPLHGWPTLILPYVDNVEYYDAMNFARPWDDPEMTAPPLPSNRAITDAPIGIYRNPGVGVAAVGRSPYLGYATNAWVVGAGKPIRLNRIADGDSQTILGGEAAGDYKPWGSPVHWRDPGLGINKTPQGFGGPWKEGGANFLFADGAVRFLRDNLAPATFRALATPNGGEAEVDLDDLE